MPDDPVDSSSAKSFSVASVAIADEETAEIAPGEGRASWNTLLGRYAIVLVLLLLVVGFSLLRPDTFFTIGNFKSILVTQAVVIVLALGLTVALAAGEFDLSIASMIGFTGALVAHLTSQLGWAVVPAIIVSFLAAVAVGSVNGLVVVHYRVNSFIATLGMGSIILGIALAITGTTVIGGLPDGITEPARAQLFGFDLPVYYALALAAALWFFFEYTPLGRYVFFTGEGPDAARLAGVPVARIRFFSLIASALFAWLAGLLLVGQTGAANPSYGGPFLLPAFAACFLGATTIKPGRFNAWGTVVAALLLATGTTGLQLLGAATWVESVFNGAALVLAVTLAQLVSRDR